jgi:TP901 family phage tail tape measure protein
MQKSLYDIFSSMDVSLEGSKHLLKEFSKAAVAGQVDLQEAARGTIGILNAYKLGAEGVNRVNDVMFQLVRKGVGTYGEFARTIGRSVPSAVRAGQSIESLAGMLAFLTRNGLSAAMASASAGRALDAISHPKTIKHFKELGYFMEDVMNPEQLARMKAAGIDMHTLSANVQDVNGKIRPMNDIMTEMGSAFKTAGLNSKQMAEVLYEMFKGSGGTIQARRFFDIAVRNFGDLNSLTNSMTHSTGALGDAYKIMAKEPATAIQLLKNNWAILKTEMGDQFLPVLLKLVKMFTGLAQWLNNLSPAAKKTIAWIFAITSVLLVLVGMITAISGFFMILGAAAAALGIGMMTLVGIFLGVIAAIVAIGVAVYFIIKYWKPISAFFVGLWNGIVTIFKNAWNAIWPPIKTTLQIIWTIIKVGFQAFVILIKIYLALALAPIIAMWLIVKGVFQLFWKWCGPYIKQQFNDFVLKVRIFIAVVKVIFKALWDGIKFVFQLFWKWCGPFIKTNLMMIKLMWSVAWNSIKDTASSIWNGIKAGFNAFWGAIKTGFKNSVSSIVAIWNSIRKPMATPVNFIIDVVWNNGIAKVWNIAAKIVGLGDKFKAPHVDGIKARTGGLIRGPGGPTGDKIPALLSDKEFVVNAKSAQKHAGLLWAINSGSFRGAPGFKKGGGIGDWFGSAWNGVKGAMGGIKDAATFMADALTDPKKLIQKIMSAPLALLKKITNTQWGQLIAAVPKKMVGMLMDGFASLTKKFFPGGAGGAGVVGAARGMIGYPYSWGGGGPGGPSYGIGRGAGTYGFDCSGLTEYAWWKGAKKHIGGTTYEQHPRSRAIGVPRPGALGFPHMGHVVLASDKPGWIIEAQQTGTFVHERQRSGISDWRWPMAQGGMATIKAAAAFMNGSRAVGSRGVLNSGDPSTLFPGWKRKGEVYDNGGYLQPGLHAFVRNNTGRKERILNPEQTQQWDRGRAGVLVNVYTQEIDPRRHAAELGWEINRRADT